MRHRVMEYDNTLSGIGADFKTTMLHVIDERFKAYFEFCEKNHELILASISVPFCKDNFIENDENYSYAKQLLIAECKKLSNTVQNTDNTHSMHVSQPAPINNVFISFASQRTVRRNSLDTEVELEVSRFLMDERTNITILNEYPMIREIYFKYNTTLSSSAAVELVFSQSMMIFTPRRNRLSAKNFEQTLLLKHNRKIIDYKTNNIDKIFSNDVIHNEK